MRIIDRYIFLNIVKVFASCIIVFSMLYILIDITINLDELIDRKVSYSLLISYYASYIPIILINTSAVCCLIAALFTYSTLNSNNEVIALRASGLNFWQLTKPAICFGLIVSALVFWVNEKYVPQATVSTEKIKNEELVRKEKSDKRKLHKIQNLAFYGLENRLFHIGTFDPNTYDLKTITIVKHNNDQNLEEKIVAYEGKWTGINWRFFNGQITKYDPVNNRPVKIIPFRSKLMEIQETPDELLKQKINVESMNIRQLKEYIDKFSNSGANKAINNLWVDIHQKIAFPIGNFVVILVGLPFALMVKSRKASNLSSFGIAVGIGFLYYVINAVSLAFGKGGLFPPLLSAWAAPLLVTGIALFLIETNY